MMVTTRLLSQSTSFSPRSGTPRVILGSIGDSRLHHDVANYTVVPGSQPGINDTVVPATGKVAGKSTRGILTWLEGLSLGQIRCPIYDTQSASAGQVSWTQLHNQAIGGSITASMPVQISRLLAQSVLPTHVAMISGYNDTAYYGIFADADALSTLIIAKANYISAWASLVAAGIQPITIVDIPADFAGNTSRVKFHQALRQWQRENAELNGSWFIDVADIAADPASSVGGPLAALYAVETPTVHPGPQLCKLVGSKLLTLFTNKGRLTNPYYGQSREDTYDATVVTHGNLLPQSGLMLGTTGTFNGSNAPTGQAPTGWSGRNNNGGTGGIVSSVQARTAGQGQGQDWNLVVTATTDTYLQCYTDLGNVAIGDIVSGSIEVNVDSSVNLSYMNVYLQEIDSTGATSYQQCGMMLGGAASGYGLMPTTYSIRPYSEKMLLGNTGCKVRVMVEMYISAGGSATIRIGAGEVRKN